MKRSELQRKTPLQSHTSLKRTSMNRTRRSKASKVQKFWIVPEQRKRSEYTEELRQFIRERDGWCKVCGKAGGMIHHVIPKGRYKVHPERYLLNGMHDPRNLMFICLTCHVWAHDREANLQTVIQIQEKRFGPIRKVA